MVGGARCRARRVRVRNRAQPRLGKMSGFSLAHLRADRRHAARGSRHPTARARSPRVHEVLDLEPRPHRPCSTASRCPLRPGTVFELAGSVHPQRVPSGRSTACGRGTSRADRLLDQMFDDWADRGRAGTGADARSCSRRARSATSRRPATSKPASPPSPSDYWDRPVPSSGRPRRCRAWIGSCATSSTSAVHWWSRS